MSNYILSDTPWERPAGSKPPALPAEPMIRHGEVRVGTAQRGEAQARLDEFWASGHLSDAEHAARAAALVKAETEHDLKFLLADLPQPPAPPSPPQPVTLGDVARAVKRSRLLPYLTSLTLAGTGVFSIYGAVSIPAPHGDATGGAVGLLLLGVLMLIVAAVALFFAVEQARDRRREQRHATVLRAHRGTR